MKLFSRFFARRDSNLATALERQRLGRTMPGQTAALAGARLGMLRLISAKNRQLAVCELRRRGRLRLSAAHCFGVCGSPRTCA